MSINLRLLLPEETTNYVLNPQLRYTTDGWTLKGSTISRTLDYARFGIASLKVVTAGSVFNEGAYYRVSSLQGVSDNVTVSAYVRGSGKVRIRLIDNPTGAEFTSQPVSLTPDRWQRLIVTGRIAGTAAGDDVRLYVETADSVARAITFYIDGAQMERKPYATSYCDGDEPGCRWNVVNSGSISTRTGDTRAGGRWIDLAGPCRGNDDLYVSVLGGMGAAPISNQVQPFALAAGSFYQGYKVNNRVVTFSFHTKNEDATADDPSLRRLHELRQQLIDIIKPDLTIGGEAFLLEYSDTDADRPLYCRFRYEAGLEGEWDIRNGWFNNFPMRLLAVDPYWVEDSQDVVNLGISTPYTVTPTTTIPVFKKSAEGVFSSLPILSEFYCGAILEAPDGSIYIAGKQYGSYPTILGARVYKYDGTTFTLIGQNAETNTEVYALEMDAQGNLWIGGRFASLAGVAAANIIKYNPTTGVFSALGAGANSDVLTICCAKNGQVYIGGAFTSAGGVTNSYIARWDGLQWRTVGAASGFKTGDTVYSIVRGKDSNTLYVGGKLTFDRFSSVAYNNIVSVDIATNLISAAGNGITISSGAVRDLAVGVDGTVFAGTEESGSIGRVFEWNGGNLWNQLGDDFDNNVNVLQIGNNGELYAGGLFVYSGSIKLSTAAVWEGNSWKPIEIDSSTTIVSFYTVSMLYSRGGHYKASALTMASALEWVGV